MNKHPLVSIIIPVYNGSDYLREAIDSALAQTYQNIEILVINDGSNDNVKTENIALSYGEKIRYYSKNNGGVSSALNLGIREMQGEYFSWLSHDDRYYPEKIENQIDCLNKFGGEENVICLCNVDCIDSESQLICEAKNRNLTMNTIISNIEVIENCFKQGCVNGCTLLVPKKAFDECGGFDENLRFSQDLLMWLKIFVAGYRAVYITKTLVSTRIHAGQLTQRGRSLIKKDSLYVSKVIAEDIAKLSSKEHNLILYTTKRSAANFCIDCVRYNIKCARSMHLFSFFNTLSVWTTVLYGSVRPLIRKMYYKFVKKADV